MTEPVVLRADERKLIADVASEALDIVWLWMGKDDERAFNECFIRVFQMGYQRGREVAVLLDVSIGTVHG